MSIVRPASTLQTPADQVADNTAAPMRCELCGALRSTRLSDHHTDIQAAEAIRRIAFLADEDPLGAVLLLRRVAHPRATYAELADGTGRTRDWICKKMHKLRKKYPGLQAFLGFDRRKARAQQARRSRENIQQGKE